MLRLSSDAESSQGLAVTALSKAAAVRGRDEVRRDAAPAEDLKGQLRLDAPAAEDARSYGAWAHAIWFSGDPGIVRSAIASLPAPTEAQRPALAVFRSCSVLSSGDVSGAFALLRQAYMLSNDVASDYYSDILVIRALLSYGPSAADEELARFRGNVTDLAANFLATRSVVAAAYGSYADSRCYAKEALAMSTLDLPLYRALIVQRSALAAFHRSELDLSEELALESVRLSTQCSMRRIACTGWSILRGIATLKNEHSEARFYAQRMADIAAEMRDGSLAAYGLVCLLEHAADGGDENEYAYVKGRLLRDGNLLQPEQRFAVKVADVLCLGWNRRFGDAREILERHLTLTLQDATHHSFARGERSLCFALLGGAFLGLNDTDGCRRFTRRAISESQRRAEAHEAPTHADWRQKARVVAAATCVAVGDRIRANRALSAEYRKHTNFVKAFSCPPIETDTTHMSWRGYARFITSAQHAYLEQNPVHLTHAETQVLSLLVDGMTTSEIARHLDKAPSTVKMQVRSAYHRLGVQNRIDAIRRARELGLQSHVV